MTCYNICIKNKLVKLISMLSTEVSKESKAKLQAS